MQGHVEVGVTAAPMRNFTDVSVVLYTKNGSVIKRVKLGAMSTDPDHHPFRQPVNITTAQQPTYVLIESLDFWQGDVSVTAFRWTGDRYTDYWIEGEGGRFP